MNYSTIGILAIIILAIVNQDVLWKRHEDAEPSLKAYRAFLFGVLTYYITDALWGIFDDLHLISAIYVDTEVYFIAMGVAVYLWARNVALYLGQKDIIGKVLLILGMVFFAFSVIAVIANVWIPIVFWFDESGTYQAGPIRYLLLIFQVVMFIFTAIYTFAARRFAEGSTRRRYLAIGAFGVAMAALIVVQLYFPLLPLYAMGCMIGTCLLHTFVVEDEKEESRLLLEEMLLHEREQELELGATRELVYTDALTGVKNKRAYVEAEAMLNARIATGQIGEFALVAFDLNELKHTNDTLGHEAGDQYIVESCKFMCSTFKHSPIYRIGGDEFIAILEDEDYVNRTELLAAFDAQVEQNLKTGGPIVSAGISVYNPTQDSNCWEIFDRADAKMYLRKSELKSMGAVTRD